MDINTIFHIINASYTWHINTYHLGLHCLLKENDIKYETEMSSDLPSKKSFELIQHSVEISVEMLPST